MAVSPALTRRIIDWPMACREYIRLRRLYEASLRNGGTFSCRLETQSAHQGGSLPIPKGVMLSHRALTLQQAINS
jgi:hypothetical protein